jgi:hypothetical protein
MGCLLFSTKPLNFSFPNQAGIRCPTMDPPESEPPSFKNRLVLFPNKLAFENLFLGRLLFVFP